MNEPLRATKYGFTIIVRFHAQPNKIGPWSIGFSKKGPNDNDPIMWVDPKIVPQALIDGIRIYLSQKTYQKQMGLQQWLDRMFPNASAD